MQPLSAMNLTQNFTRLFITILAAAVLIGVGTGYVMSKNNKAAGLLPQATPKTAQQDTHTFRDFAEGTITKKTSTDDYNEGTHILKRDGADPVALTSSVVDLSQYEGKKVKVYGETQKALKAGWLMDVGRVDVK